MVLFQETFGPGRNRFWRRPSIFHWPQALARALDQTLECSRCQMTYYYDPIDDSQCCPFCEAYRPPLLRVAAYDWMGGRSAFDAPAWQWVREVPVEPQMPLRLPKRLFFPFSMSDSDRGIMEFSPNLDEVLLRRVDGGEDLRFAVAVPAQSMRHFVEFVGDIRLPAVAREKGFWLRSDGLQPRMLRFSLEGVAR